MVESDADVRHDWWHVIAAAPFAYLTGALIGGAVGGIVILGFGLLYPFAIRGDTKFVTGTPSDWNPNPTTYTLFGICVFPLTLGLLSLLVSPVYLYLRWKHVG